MTSTAYTMLWTAHAVLTRQLADARAEEKAANEADDAARARLAEARTRVNRIASAELALGQLLATTAAETEVAA
jgi:hypothetical protein